MSAKVRQSITVSEEGYKGDARRVIAELAKVVEANEGAVTSLSAETKPTRWQNYSRVTAKVTITREVY